MTDPSTLRGDRRSVARRACRLIVRYRTAGPWHPATAVDVSARGCRLRVGEPLERGASVDLAFARPGPASEDVRVQGKVTWCRPEGLSHQAGLHFPEPFETIEALLAPVSEP
jgi:hypothetical protein